MRTILVVDDEYVVLDALSMLLEAEGYRVRKASHGGEALTRLLEDVPDAILCDVSMPVLDGVALLHAVRADARLADVAFVFMVEPFGRRPPELAVASGTLEKPIRLRDLIDALTALGISPQPL